MLAAVMGDFRSIIEKFPNVDITGVDISENYVRLYKEYTCHPAFVVGIENIPSNLGTFDYILCVTVLMYLDDESLGKAVFNLLSHLKPQGKLILIEPNQSGFLFQTGFGLLSLWNRIQKTSIHTGGRFFRTNEIENRFSHARGKILLERRLPITSLCILPLTFIGIILPSRLAKGIYKTVSFLDALLSKFRLPSIYGAYLITRN
jgi:2-polyprenyl-3-methyl-5-hydroxy-6-metoxy-1,4-benzoquinol methylase